MMNIPPDICRECEHICGYTTGCFSRNPHYCCELIWELFRQDYKVDPDALDKNCPYRNSDFIKHELYRRGWTDELRKE